MKGSEAVEIKKGMKVKAHDSYCIDFSPVYNDKDGEIVKVNQKSFYAVFNHEVRSQSGRNGSVVLSEDYIETKPVKFTYWKTCNDGVVVYKSEFDGKIEF